MPPESQQTTQKKQETPATLTTYSQRILSLLDKIPDPRDKNSLIGSGIKKLATVITAAQQTIENEQNGQQEKKQAHALCLLASTYSNQLQAILEPITAKMNAFRLIITRLADGELKDCTRAIDPYLSTCCEKGERLSEAQRVLGLALYLPRISLEALAELWRSTKKLLATMELTGDEAEELKKLEKRPFFKEENQRVLVFLSHKHLVSQDNPVLFSLKETVVSTKTGMGYALEDKAYAEQLCQKRVGEGDLIVVSLEKRFCASATDPTICYVDPVYLDAYAESFPDNMPMAARLNEHLSLPLPTGYGFIPLNTAASERVHELISQSKLYSAILLPYSEQDAVNEQKKSTLMRRVRRDYSKKSIPKPPASHATKTTGLAAEEQQAINDKVAAATLASAKKQIKQLLNDLEKIVFPEEEAAASRDRVPKVKRELSDPEDSEQKRIMKDLKDLLSQFSKQLFEEVEEVAGEKPGTEAETIQKRVDRIKARIRTFERNKFLPIALSWLTGENPNPTRAMGAIAGYFGKKAPSQISGRNNKAKMDEVFSDLRRFVLEGFEESPKEDLRQFIQRIFDHFKADPEQRFQSNENFWTDLAYKTGGELTPYRKGIVEIDKTLKEAQQFIAKHKQTKEKEKAERKAERERQEAERKAAEEKQRAEEELKYQQETLRKNIKELLENLDETLTEESIGSIKAKLMKYEEEATRLNMGYALASEFKPIRNSISAFENTIAERKLDAACKLFSSPPDKKDYYTPGNSNGKAQRFLLEEVAQAYAKAFKDIAAYLPLDEADIANSPVLLLLSFDASAANKTTNETPELHTKTTPLMMVDHLVDWCVEFYEERSNVVLKLMTALHQRSQKSPKAARRIAEKLYWHLEEDIPAELVDWRRSFLSEEKENALTLQNFSDFLTRSTIILKEKLPLSAQWFVDLTDELQRWLVDFNEIKSPNVNENFFDKIVDLREALNGYLSSTRQGNLLIIGYLTDSDAIKNLLRRELEPIQKGQKPDLLSKKEYSDEDRQNIADGFLASHSDLLSKKTHSREDIEIIADCFLERLEGFIEETRQLFQSMQGFDGPLQEAENLLYTFQCQTANTISSLPNFPLPPDYFFNGMNHESPQERAASIQRLQHWLRNTGNSSNKLTQEYNQQMEYALHFYWQAIRANQTPAATTDRRRTAPPPSPLRHSQAPLMPPPGLAAPPKQQTQPGAANLNSIAGTKPAAQPLSRAAFFAGAKQVEHRGPLTTIVRSPSTATG